MSSECLNLLISPQELNSLVRGTGGQCRQAVSRGRGRLCTHPVSSPLCALLFHIALFSLLPPLLPYPWLLRLALCLLPGCLAAPRSPKSCSIYVCLSHIQEPAGPRGGSAARLSPGQLLHDRGCHRPAHVSLPLDRYQRQWVLQPVSQS